MYIATNRRAGFAVDFGGLGDAAQVVGQTSSLGVPLLEGAIAAHAASTAAATGSSAVILGMAPALAIPIIGAALAGVTLGVMALLRSGCGQTCVVTSQWANQAEPLLRQNIEAYFNLPAPRTESQRNAALNNYEVIWQRLQQLCGQAGTGDAGVRCISDRQAGACKWRQTGASPWPGGPALGDCWNWDAAYRVPIAADPVIPDAQAAVSSAAASVSSVVGANPLLALAGAGLLLWVVLS